MLMIKGFPNKSDFRIFGFVLAVLAVLLVFVNEFWFNFGIIIGVVGVVLFWWGFRSET